MTTMRHMDNLARAQRNYDEAADSVFDAADRLADYMEDGGVLITDMTPGQVRLCAPFIDLRAAVDLVQERAHQLSIHQLITDYYETED
jgi:hypothetical protein